MEKFNEMWLYNAFLLDNIAKSQVGAKFVNFPFKKQFLHNKTV